MRWCSSPRKWLALRKISQGAYRDRRFSIHRPHLGLSPSRQRRAVNSNLWISCGKLWIKSLLCGELAQLFQKSRKLAKKKPPIFGGSFRSYPRYGSVDKSLFLWIICPVSSTGFPPQGWSGLKTESTQGMGAVGWSLSISWGRLGCVHTIHRAYY